MDQKTTQAAQALGKELLEFRSDFRSVLLSTISHEGVPEASYAPCVTDNANNIYIYVSGLSRHTRNLRDTGRVSLLFIEDEQAARNIFARKRLSYQCEAEAVARESEDWNQVLRRFTDRFGKFVDTLRSLPDFQLFRLTPRSGTYVRGFAQAYSFQGAGVGDLRLINPSQETQQPPDVSTAEKVLEFWFSETVRPLWFRATKEFDRELRTLFMSTWQFAAANRLASWESSPQGALALIIVLDQFPLNMFRGRPESFSTEPDARRVAEAAIAKGYDQELNHSQRVFMYMPFMHSEDLDDQKRSVKLYQAIGSEGNSEWARHHYDIIRRFGRFPHRNAILGRESTPAESAYLNSTGAFSG